MKTCKVCNRLLPKACFTAHPMSADRLQPKCRECRRVYDQGRYAEVREQQIKQATAWRLANNERVREINRKMDRKRVKEQNRKSIAYGRRMRQATPPWADMPAILQAYEVAEVLSGGGVKFHVDHYYPLNGKTVSGLHVETNLQVIPAYLNLSKGNRHPNP